MTRSKREPRGLENLLSRRAVMAVAGSVILERPRIAFAARNAMPVTGFLDAAASTADELAAFYDGLKVEVISAIKR